MTDNNTALKKAGLKVTLPRLKILEVLQGPDNHHVSAEDLYKRLIDMGGRDWFGYRFTVY
ncbi:Ferric uptake regulation protein [Leclercia adecarboxylata]|uniref:Ferric uptake regulation protein n=1 Tax=Leclercia adecarboxylata TaxID=83655 RepID=A0A4U9HLQ9_9ENTR|nr:Ferric uptake regulation protein [Leclercia adecarboxylata]